MGVGQSGRRLAIRQGDVAVSSVVLRDGTVNSNVVSWINLNIFCKIRKGLLKLICVFNILYLKTNVCSLVIAVIMLDEVFDEVFVEVFDEEFVEVFDGVFTFSQACSVTLTLVPEADGAAVFGVFFDRLSENAAH